MDIEPLSEAGQLRRQGILRLAQGEARRLRRRRLIGRGSPPVIAIAAAAIILRPHHLPRPTPAPVAGIAVPAPQPIAASAGVQFIPTDSTITDRLSTQPSTPRWTDISDRELLDELNAVGEPAGIVSINGRTFLLPGNPAN